MPNFPTFRRALKVLLPLLLATTASLAAPRLPDDDNQILERLPARAVDPRQREMVDLRRSLAAQPNDLALALRLARRYYAEVAAEGDPRYIGYAQAALAPWWDLPDPPVEARVMRAILLQFNHHFDAAMADLRAAVQADPSHGEAWSWLAAIAMVRADYGLARQACERFAPLTTPSIAAACIAYIDATTGKGDAAAVSLRAALRQDVKAEPGQRLWALTRLAEIEERRGAQAAAEAAYREALSLGIIDGYLLAAYSDFLLDLGRGSEVLALLEGRERSDLLLLRLALAAKASSNPQRADWQRDLGARFDAARLRGDTVHQKEESRYALQLLGDAPRALTLALENYAVQREPADARIVLEAAIATRQPAAAEPVLTWMKASGIDSVTLRRLALQLGSGS